MTARSTSSSQTNQPSLPTRAQTHQPPPFNSFFNKAETKDTLKSRHIEKKNHACIVSSSYHRFPPPASALVSFGL